MAKCKHYEWEAKPKWVTIKGWASKTDGGLWAALEQGGKVLEYPCEIRIKAKYLKATK